MLTSAHKPATMVSGVPLGSAILTSEADMCLKLDARENSCLIKNGSHKDGAGEKGGAKERVCL